MGKVISFIIPAYNSQQYLKKCLDSFLVEDCLDYIEVIVVNDGSTDQTQTLAEDYARDYPGVFRVLNKENGGHGSAINEGVQVASGRYMKVIDADDWIQSDKLGRAVECLKNCGAQAVIMPYYTVDMQTGERIKRDLYYGDSEKNCDLHYIVQNWRSLEHGLTFHGIIYKTDFYKEKGIRLAEHVFYEDHEYATIPLCLADTVLLEEGISLYEYMIGNSQQSVAAANQVKRLGHMEQVIEHMLCFLGDQKNISEDGKQFFYKKLEGLILTYYRTACFISPDRNAGRKRVKQENAKIFPKLSEWKAVLQKKYRIFAFFSVCGLQIEQYEKILNSSFYKKIRGKVNN